MIECPFCHLMVEEAVGAMHLETQHPVELEATLNASVKLSEILTQFIKFKKDIGWPY